MAFTTVQYIRQVATNISNVLTTNYTVPASRQDVIKCINICNPTGSAITVSINMGGANLFATMVIPATQTLTWTGTIVLNAGDTIQSQGSVSGLQLTVSGLESQ